MLFGSRCLATRSAALLGLSASHAFAWACDYPSTSVPCMHGTLIRSLHKAIMHDLGAPLMRFIDVAGH